MVFSMRGKSVAIGPTAVSRSDRGLEHKTAGSGFLLDAREVLQSAPNHVGESCSCLALFMATFTHRTVMPFRYDDTVDRTIVLRYIVLWNNQMPTMVV